MNLPLEVQVYFAVNCPEHFTNIGRFNCSVEKASKNWYLCSQTYPFPPENLLKSENPGENQAQHIISLNAIRLNFLTEFHGVYVRTFIRMG